MCTLARAIIGLAALVAALHMRASSDSVAALAARVIVLANSDDPDSLRLAHYYAERRGVPPANIFAYKMPLAETITWPEFVATIWRPLQKDLVRSGWINAIEMDLTDRAGRTKYAIHDHRIAYLVVCRGVPLRIANQPDWSLEPAVIPIADRPEFTTHQAAVDSEFALLAESIHPTGRFIPNILFQNEKPTAYEESRVVKTTRLDGPTFDDARALIDHALEAERTGLIGRAYVDRGGISEEGDRWLDRIVLQLNELGFDTDTDSASSTMPAIARCDAPALYFGWYAENLNGPFALPGFRFPPGAIALHIHSSSAYTLRSPREGWCGPLVARGATATTGAVYEPYLQLLHWPHLLLHALSRGSTFGDAACYALPALSWQSVAIGDPLYRPFAVRSEEQWARRRQLAPGMSAYVALRQMKLLEAAHNADDALALAQTELAEAPSLPLALAVAERLLRANDTAGAAKAFERVPHNAVLTANEWALAHAAARLLVSAKAPASAVSLYRQIFASSELPPELRSAWFPDAIIAADAAGDVAQGKAWSAELAAAAIP